MIEMIEIIKIILLGIVEGITEWLPISSTGHMILLDEFIKLKADKDFKEIFFVLIQLGAICAVLSMYWKKIFPINKKILYRKNDANKNLPPTKTIFYFDKEKMLLISKILVACVPAGIIGILFDDFLDAKFYNFLTVSIMLIIYGILFIIIENKLGKKTSSINELSEITFKGALFIGIFQILALIPGTSRSGATIIGGMLTNVSRTISAEFTFLLAIPVMLGASLLKIIKLGFSFSITESIYLIIGLITAYIVSILSIKFLLSYIKNKDFKFFGYYRIVLGLILLIYYFTFK